MTPLLHDRHERQVLIDLPQQDRAIALLKNQAALRVPTADLILELLVPRRAFQRVAFAVAHDHPAAKSGDAAWRVRHVFAVTPGVADIDAGDQVGGLGDDEGVGDERADADALYDQWSRPGLGGHTHPVGPTDYKLREGSHVDPDGNLIRFGSPIEAIEAIEAIEE